MSVLTDFFTSLANKIRSKTGNSETLTPPQMISEIDNIYTPTQTKSVTASTSTTTVTPDTGYALSSVTVKPTPSQEKTVTAGTSAASVTPDSGKLLSKVTYNPTPSQTKSASPSTSAQTISPDSGKLLSSVSISAMSPQRSAGTAATLTGVDSTGPYVYFPYGWWPQNNATYGNYTRMTAAQAVTACPKQEKTITSSRSAQTVTPDSGKLLSKVTVNALTPTGTFNASTTRSTAIDMGATNNYRYVNTNSVSNTNSGTYTFAANDTGGTKDMGSTNTYRYVNASNVYSAGRNSTANRVNFCVRGTGEMWIPVKTPFTCSKIYISQVQIDSGSLANVDTIQLATNNLGTYTSVQLSGAVGHYISLANSDFVIVHIKSSGYHSIWISGTVV